MSKHIDQIASKQTPLKFPYLKRYYLNNIPTTALLSTLFGKYIAQKYMTNKLANTNCTRMEHFSSLDITVGSKELAIVRDCLDGTLICSN